MQPEPKKHVSHAIAWSLIALLTGSLAFGIWTYFSQISDIYDSSVTISFSHKKTATTKPTTATTGTTTTDVTADWKTYSDSTYGFSFKYPKDWTTKNTDISKGDFYATASTGNGANHEYFYSHVEKYSGSASDYLSKLKNQDSDNVDQGGPTHNFGDGKAYTIGGIQGLKLVNISSMAAKHDWYIVKNGNNIYQIEVLLKPGEGDVYDPTQYTTIANTILSTFTFTK